MKIYHLHREQFLPISIQESWSFFSDPSNLEAITPPRMKFAIQHLSGTGMYPGKLIRYRITIFPFYRANWLTEITAVKEQEYFIDDQRIGPYALWHHYHHFQEVENGVLMTDEVTYALPFGWLGQWAHALLIGRELNGIFEHRRRVLDARFTKENKNVTLEV